MNGFTDKELWNAIVADNDKAFAVLYHRYWKKIYNSVKHYLKDETAAEEALQDIFIVLWNKRKQLEIDNFASYIHVSARYHVLKQLRDAKRSPIEYVPEYEKDSGQLTYNEGVEAMDWSDFKHQLNDSLKGLPKRCKEVFWMSRVELLSNNEIANQLDISKRTVENQITYALKHLRQSCKEVDHHLFLAMIFMMSYLNS